MLFLTIEAVKVVTLFKIYVENSWAPVTSAAIKHSNNMDILLDGALPKEAFIVIAFVHFSHCAQAVTENVTMAFVEKDH